MSVIKQPGQKLRSRLCGSEYDAIAFVSGQVAPVDRELFMEHISQCEVCRKRIASLTRLILSEETAEESSRIEALHDRTAAAILRLWKRHKKRPTTRPRANARLSPKGI